MVSKWFLSDMRMFPELSKNGQKVMFPIEGLSGSFSKTYEIVEDCIKLNKAQSSSVFNLSSKF